MRPKATTVKIRGPITTQERYREQARKQLPAGKVMHIQADPRPHGMRVDPLRK